MQNLDQERPTLPCRQSCSLKQLSSRFSRELCVIGYNNISEDAEAARAILKAWKGDRGLAAQLHERPLLHLLHLLRLKLDKLKVLQV